jgi:hypothetical protein
MTATTAIGVRMARTFVLAAVAPVVKGLAPAKANSGTARTVAVTMTRNINEARYPRRSRPCRIEYLAIGKFMCVSQ